MDNQPNMCQAVTKGQSIFDWKQRLITICQKKGGLHSNQDPRLWLI